MIIRLPKPNLRKLTDWWTNLPSLEQELAREACEKINKVESEWRRRDVFYKLLKQWQLEDPKLAKQFARHKDHLFRENEDLR